MKRRPDEPMPPPRADGLFDNLPKAQSNLPKPMEVATGLSDEVDAHRYLARRFNTGFSCRRCDASWEQKFDICPVCSHKYITASDIDARMQAMFRRKRK